MGIGTFATWLPRTRVRSGPPSIAVRLIYSLGALALPSCSEGPEREQDGHGVLVISIDALRADHCGSYGYDRDTTPTLDGLAAEGIVFDRAWSAAPQSVPAHAALLTGCDPNVSRRTLPKEVAHSLVTTWGVPKEAPHLAREFLAAGYSTAAFMDDAALSPNLGLALGFEHFPLESARGGREVHDSGLEGEAAEFLGWLRSRGQRENWFAYLHYADLEDIWWESDPLWDSHYEPRPELDYVPPVSTASEVFFAIPQNRWSGGLSTLGQYEARYDGGIRRLDESIGRLLKHLDRLGRLDKTTIVVTGAFGLSFGETGLILDHGTLGTVDLHVPLILRPSPAHGAGWFERSGDGTIQRCGALVSSLDLGPTLLDLVDIPIPERMQGHSLEPVLGGDALRVREFAFASCGVSEGYAAIHLDHGLRSVLRGSGGSYAARVSWFGGSARDSDELWEELVEFPLGGSLAQARVLDLEEEGPAEEASRLRAAAETWFRGVHVMRTELQTDSWFTGNEEAVPVPSPRVWSLAKERP